MSANAIMASTKPRRGDRPMPEIDLATAEDALSYVSSADRDTWLRAGRALYDEFGDDAFTAWDGWSQGSPNYNAKAAQATWKSCRKPGRGGKPVTIATVIWLAQQNGWKLRREHQVNRSAGETARINAEREARRAAALAEEAVAEERAAARALAAWNAATPAVEHAYLTRKGVQPHGTRYAPAWVKEWVDAETGEVREISHRDALLVPIWLGPGKLASLQAIFPTPCVGPRDGKRDKDYLTDGRKHGGYFTIGAIRRDTTAVIVCEGFATGASLHEATGLPTMVAFDASNLAEVSASLRAKLPAVRIVLAADNDAFTRPRADGKPWNPGVEAATAAARACAGVLAVPQFADLEGEPTDFNDLHLREGADAVRVAITAATAPPSETAKTGTTAAVVALDAEAAPAPTSTTVTAESAPAAGRPAATEELDIAASAPFAVLGFKDDVYFIFDRRKRAVLAKTCRNFASDIGLVELAPRQWWEMHFPSGGRGAERIDRTAAAEWIFGQARHRGVYNPRRVRGRGAWRDKGRMVFHHGERLTVDCEAVEIERITSAHVYPAGAALPEAPAPGLTDEEGQHLIDVAGMARWTNPAAAKLLAGWTFLAPVCGALQWRPHIWITGPAGSGKSTLQRAFAGALLRDVGLVLGGSSTEAGVRQVLGLDALPVLIDEFEPNEDNDRRRIGGVLTMIRSASSEGGTRSVKGTVAGSAMSFDVRSMFAVASINVMLDKDSDSSRLTVLTIHPPGEGRAPDQWAKLQDELHRIEKDAELPARLLTRAVGMLPTIVQNVDVFCTAAAKHLRSQRHGDQFGTLLAGSWCLTSTAVASEEEAKALVAAIDWADFLSQEASEPDATKCLWAILDAGVIHKGTQVRLRTLLAIIVGLTVDGLDIDRASAKRLLHEHGLAITKGLFLAIAVNSTPITSLLRDTRFATDWRGQLKRLPGYECLPATSFGPALKDRAHGIPLGLLRLGTAPETPEPAF